MKSILVILAGLGVVRGAASCIHLGAMGGGHGHAAAGMGTMTTGEGISRTPGPGDAQTSAPISGARVQSEATSTERAGHADRAGSPRHTVRPVAESAAPGVYRSRASIVMGHSWRSWCF